MKKDNQPAPEYPETLPCPVFLEPGMRFGKGVKTRLVLDAIQRRTEYYAELEAMTPEERAEHDANIEAFKTMFPQPAPVVLKDHQIRELVNQLRDIAIEYHGTQQLRERISRVLRASMLQDGNHTEQHLDMVDHFGDANEKGNGGTLTNEGTIQAGNSPVIPDGWKLVPVEPSGDMLAAAQDAYGETDGDIASTLRAAIASAPQDTPALNPAQSVATAPGWIPVSERLPEEGGRYWCYVEEQNSLGKSHYQWNCSWNGEIWGGAMMYGRVTHWMPLPAAPQEVKGE